MAQTALSPTRVEAVGSMTQLIVGVAGGSGTSTVVTLPVGVVVKAVIMSPAEASTTVGEVATISANTFTATHGNNETFAYIAFCTGGV